MERNKQFDPVGKLCSKCGQAFTTVDRRNNFCSSKCKAFSANKTKLEKYGTLSLESRESVARRVEKSKKEKVLCSIDGCKNYSRNRKMCAAHYIKNYYLKTPEGIETYRLNNQKRRHADRETKVLLKCELQFLRKLQTECAKCGKNGDLTIDHHVPLSRGGRLCVDNVVLLCQSCNSKKHGKLPEEFYTTNELSLISERFKFIADYKNSLPIVYFLFGCFGVGKSWVGDQLTDQFFVVDYDDHRFKSIEIIDALPKTKPIIFMSSIGITAFMNKHGMKYNIIPVAIIEDLATIDARLKMRGGSMTESVKRRFDRVSSIASRYAQVAGNSVQILEYFNNL